MKKYLTILLIALVMVCGVAQTAQSKTKKKSLTTTATRPKTINGIVNEITPSEFKILVADWSKRPYTFKGRRVTVVDVSASWCGWCKKLDPVFQRLARQYSGRVDFYRIDGNCYSEIMRAYGLKSYPSVLVWAPNYGLVDQSAGFKEESYYIREINSAFRMEQAHKYDRDTF